MPLKVLVTRRLPGDAVSGLEHRFELVLNREDRDLTYEELNEMARGAAGVLSMLSNRIDRAFIESHPELRVVSNYAVGYNNIDLAAARDHGVTVTNTPGVLTETTADLAWALIMAVCRRVVEGDSLTREGRFDGWAPEMLLGVDIHGRTLGIVGMGRIGTAVARRASGFGMKILYHNRDPKPGVEKELGARRVELDTLLAGSDIVSLHTPLTDGTTHLIDRRRLGLMKPTAVLINTARGPVVDEAALVEALRERRIFGAGLDVYEREPELHPGLADLPNTVLLPHLGSASTATRQRMTRIAVDNLTAVLEGREPSHPVSLP